jgi:L-fuconolactonase
MPDFPIVDAHVHFWDDGVNRVSWTRAHPALDRPFGPSGLDQDRGGVALAAFVVVEADVDAGLYLKEAAWAAQLAADEPRLRGVVAHAPLEYGSAVGSDLEKLAAQPSVRGVRRSLRGRAGEELVRDPVFGEALRLLARFDLHFELRVDHRLLPAAVALVEACPEVRFVLDHVAWAEAAAEPTAAGWDHLADLAAMEHVVACKVAGGPTAPDDVGDTAPDRFRERALEAFGAERVMFASHWPVSRPAIGYGENVARVERAVAEWPAADRRRLFVDNAARVYRLD